ncbi:MAG: ABC transporter permease [Hyphomicrobiaceae bacterium]
MSSEALTTPARHVRRSRAGILTLALRDLRGGLKGFYVFVACVALGVAVIAAVGGLAASMRDGVVRQGGLLLGGDVRLSRPHHRMTPAERAWLQSGGRVSEMATMRAIARRPDGSEQALVEIKAVDEAYPLVGELVLSSGRLGSVRAAGGAIVDPILLERLGLKVGDRIALGALELPVTAALVSEPDKLTDRLTFGPRVLISLQNLEKTGLVKPGSLVRWRYSVKLAGASQAPSDKALDAFRVALDKALPAAGFVVRDRRDPAPSVTRTLDRLREFLTLIGLASLIVGGVGVANAVTTFVDRRRKVIATLKSVGATGRTVFAIYLTEVMLIAGIGVLIGLALGSALPIGVVALLGDAMPLRPEVTVSPLALALAAAYGLLVALLFVLWPLGRAERVRPAVLFREEVAPESRWPRPRVVVAVIATALALAALAVLTSDSRRIAIYFIAALAALVVVFSTLGWLVTVLSRKIPRPRKPMLALAFANLGAPGGLTRAVVLSLGAGLTLLVAVSLVDASLVAEFTTRLPKQSPNYFVLDISKTDRQGFVDLVRRTAPGVEVHEAPMLRGRLVSLKGVPVERLKPPPEAQWVLNGDRGLSYSETVPEGSKVVTGAWWPKDYQGEPLVSFEAELARKLGVGLGDKVTVNVLGRNVTARIANLREVKWESLAINFVMVFSPNTLRSAPYSVLATLTLPSTAPVADEARLARVISRAYPSVTAIRVRDVINAFSGVFAKVMLAVKVAGGVTLLAGALVLAGALATSQRRRLQLAVILKTLGASRRQILTLHMIEYLLLAGVTAIIAVLLGGLAAWVALTQVMDVEPTFTARAVLEALGVSLALVLAFGGLGTWRVLQARPVPYLRSE